MIDWQKYNYNYSIKIAILIAVAVIGELVIWWAMVREESIDWISAQVVHQASPYAVSQLADGRLLVANVVRGFEITLPAGFKFTGARNPEYYYGEQGQPICEIKSQVKNYNSELTIAGLKAANKNFRETVAGNTRALKQEELTAANNLIYDLLVPLNQSVVRFSLYAGKDNAAKCRNYFEQIRRSFIYYE